MSSAAFVPAWRRNDPRIEADAIAFWKKNSILPRGVDPAERAKELCGVLYKGDEVIAVSTVVLQHMPRFRCRMAVYRCAATRAVRRSSASVLVTERSRELLEEWSVAHPEEAVMGMAAVVESELLVRHMPSVFWPANLVFMGYMPNGRQLRVAWFKHATVDAQAPARRHGLGQVPGKND